jgi:prevent-host-death family protein
VKYGKIGHRCLKTGETMAKSRAATTQRQRSASEVKAQWRDIVAEANAYGEVLITNFNRPEVVVVSMDQYTKLKHDAAANDPLVTLRAELDRELAILEGPRAASRLRKAFGASPAQLAKAANAASRRKH